MSDSATSDSRRPDLDNAAASLAGDHPRGSARPADRPVEVKIVDSGPLQIKGPIGLVDHDGRQYDVPARRAVFLCRCGQSASKPFCDGTHKRIGFQASERAETPVETE